MAAKSIAPIVAVNIGPAVVTIFGMDVPILAFSISLVTLLLARVVAPPPTRRLSRKEDVALTVLLCIVLLLAVTGEITGKPMGVGQSFLWAVGLAFSGIFVLETFGELFRRRFKAVVAVIFGGEEKSDGK